MTQLRKTWQRVRVLETLLDNNGCIDEPAGHATSRLQMLCGFSGDPAAFVTLLKQMENFNLLSREVQGKRTYKIAVKDIPNEWNVSCTTIEPEIDLREPEPEPEIDHNELQADLILENFRQDLIKTVTKFNHDICALTQSREYFMSMVNELTEENNRLRSKVSPLQDEVKAQKDINVGLRTRIRELERNIEKMTRRAAYEIRAEESFRETSKIMSEPPRPGYG